MTSAEDINFEKLAQNQTLNLDLLAQFLQSYRVSKALYLYMVDKRTSIKGRWIGAEPYIKTDAQYAFCYATNIIEGRWPEAEIYIMQNPFYFEKYKNQILNTTIQ